MENKFVRKIQTSGHDLKNLPLLAVLSLSFLSIPVIDNAYGHGLGSETFPPTELDGRLVTLEISSSQSDPETNDDQQISISLIDFDSKITLRDVIFLIKAERGEKFLFEREFKADNGFVVFNFVSEDTDSIIVEEENKSNFFGSLIGLDSRLVHVKGPKLSEGGLYKFDVTILAADGYSKTLDEPLVYNSGISIAQTTTHDFVDPNFGEKNIQVITYYDEISDFEYDPNSREVRFSMPFEWSESNINQTSVVHEEIVIQETFGDLLASGFTMFVNGVELSPNVVNVDDFFSAERTVHFTIYQTELYRIFENDPNQDGMDFVIKPDRDYSHLSSVTQNGQFRILVTWAPENLKSNSSAKILFDVTDVFLRNRPVATNYEFSMTQNDRTIYQQGGTSSDSKEEHNVAEFMIPGDVSGIVELNFYNLDNNDLAKTSVPVVIDRVVTANEISIPDWIRSNAAWWSQEQIDDSTFIQGIQYMIKNDIIVIPQTQQGTLESQDIPDWIRSNAAWWADGQIDDETFLQGLQFLIQKGILRA